MCGLVTRVCPGHEQGLTILGTPVGSEAYIRHQLQLTSQSHQQLLQRIPALDDLQASWLLLLFCASPRSNHILRTVAPELVNDFVGTHDAAVASCLQQLLGNPDLPATALATAHLPLAQGGLGLPVCRSRCSSCSLGLMGRHPASLGKTVARVHCNAIGPPCTSTWRAAACPCSARNRLSLAGQWLAPSDMAGSCPRHTAPTSTSSLSRRARGTRVAAHSSQRYTNSLSKPVAHSPETSQPSLAVFPVGATCQSSFHHHPIQLRFCIPVTCLPCLVAPSTSSSTSLGRTHLPMPSHFGLARRPSRSVCSIWGPESSRRGP